MEQFALKSFYFATISYNRDITHIIFHSDQRYEWDINRPD